MQFIVIAIALIFLSILGFGIGKSFAQVNEKKPVTSQKVAEISRSQLDDMLKQIEKKVAPEEKMGAMCYDISLPPEYQEYVCPIDGEKTVYNKADYEMYRLVADIAEMRRLVKRINVLTKLAVFSLDELSLCHKCSTLGPNEQPFISLVVTYPDKKIHVYERVTLDDLRILAGFFEKKLTYTTANDGEKPLKNELDRIKKMLKGTKLEQ